MNWNKLRLWPSSKASSTETAAEPVKTGDQHFITRHSVKPKGEDAESEAYPGISEKGVGLARERSQELLSMLEKAPAGSVMFIGGASELVRTASTGEVYGDEMKELVKDRADIEVITRSEIEGGGAEEGYTKLVKSIADRIAANPEKKFVVDFPLFLKGLSASHFVNKEGKMLPYFEALGKKHGDNEYAQLSEWIATNGAAQDGGPEGPNPEMIAGDVEQSLARLREFANKHVDGRPLIVGLVGHSWFMDAFLMQAALGKISKENLDRMTGGRRMIKETEAAYIEMDGGKTRVSYRGNNFTREASKS